MAPAPGFGLAGTAAAPCAVPGQALQAEAAAPTTVAGMQAAIQASVLRTASAAAQLHKLLGTAKQLKATLGSVAHEARASGDGGSVAAGHVPNAFATGGAQPSASNIEQMAAAAHAQSAQIQAMAQDAEMQRMQIAMQMQMAAATELQSQEDDLKRNARPSSPEPGRKRSRGQKETSEYFYDMEMAAQRDREQPGVATSDLVEKVKVIKRSSPRGYNAWDSYCLSKGNKTKDPRLHHDDFLRGFFEAIAMGEFGDVPGAAAVLGDGAARPPQPAALLPSASALLPPPPPFGHEERGGEGAPTRVIFIAGLPRDTKADALSAYFSSTFGKVVAVRLKYDEEGTFRGIGEVEFAEDAAGRKVLENFDHNIFQGKWINCMVSRYRRAAGSRSSQWSTFQT